MREVDKAIQMLHDFDMGDGVRLGVKVSVKPEDREKRLAKKQEEEAFINTLNCARLDDAPVSTNGYELSRQEAQCCRQNPFLPPQQLPVASSPEEPSGTGKGGGEEEEEEEAEGLALGKSAGASSLRAAAMNSQSSPGREEEPPAARVAVGHADHQADHCHMCGKPCHMWCTRCKTPYCSKRCQEGDWQTHRLVCKKLKHQARGEGGVNTASHPGEERDQQQQEQQQERASSPLVIWEKQHSEDEGFDIPTPPTEELLSVLQRMSGAMSKSPESQPPKERPRTPQQSPVEEAPAPTPPSPSQSPPSTKSEPESGRPSAPLPSSCSSDVPLSLTEVLKVFHSSSLPLPSIPLGCAPPQMFNAVVTSALSCVRFTAVLMSVETKQALKTIQAGSAASSLPVAEPLTLVVGSKVGYLDENKELYRMEVLKISLKEDAIHLKFYDFGGYITLKPSCDQLVILPEEVVTLPCLQQKCALNGMYAADKEGADYLMEVVRHTSVQITNVGSRQNTQKNSVFYLCKARVADSQVDLNHLMAEFLRKHSNSGNSRPPQAPRTPTRSQEMSPTVSQSPISPVGHTSMHDRVRHTANQPPLAKPPTPVTPTPALAPSTLRSPGTGNGQYKLMHPAKGVGRHQPPIGQDFTILPRVVNSPSSVWAHVKHPSLPNLHWMQMDLNKGYSTRRSEGYSPSVGELCVARYPEDQQFYRAEVLCVNNNGTVDVRFVDFGNREMVLLSQLHHLHPAFLTLPMQALHFSLDGVVPSGHALNWSDSAITYLKDKILRREVTARVVEERNGLFMSTFWDPDCPQRSLSEAMVSLGHADSTKALGKQPSSSPGKMPGVKTTPKGRGALLPIPATPAKSPGYLPPPPPGNLSPHHSVATPPLSNSLPHSDVPFPRTHQPVPAPGAGTLSSPLSQKPTFGQASEGGFGSVPLYSPSLSPPSPVTPPSPSERGGERGSHKPPSPASPRNARGLPPTGSLQQATQPQRKVRSEEPSAVQVPAVSLPLNKVCMALVTFVKSPTVFFVQLLDRTALAALVDLTQQLNVTTLHPLTDPHPNDFCVARYAEDGALYRGVITRCFPTSANIKFIDYGNLESVARSEVYQLPPEFARLPSQAALCTLNRYKPSSKADPQAAELFKSLVLDKQVEVRGVKLLDSDKNLPPKSIVDVKVQTEEGGRDVLAVMVEAGHSLPPQGKGPAKQCNAGRREGSPKKKNLAPPSPQRADGSSGEGSPQKRISFASINAQNAGRSVERQGQRDHSAQGPKGAGLGWEAAPRESTVSSGAKAPSSLPSAAPSASAAAAFPPLSSLATVDIPSDTEYVEVVVTDITNPLLLHLQIASQQSLQAISDLQSGLNSHTHAPPPSFLPPKGHVCCCKFSADGLWYRAVVAECQDSLCDVQFIDYGNTDTVKLENITTCPKEFIQVPIMAAKCALNGVVPPASSAPHWPQEAMTFLRSRCLDRVLLAKMEAREESGAPLVQLIDTSSDTDIYISSELIKAGLAAEPQSVPTTSQAMVVDHLPEAQLPAADEFDVLVTSVVSFTELYIHPVSPDTPHNMGTFMAAITEHCSSLPPLTTPPSTGHYCLAQFSDGNWFRAKVESVALGGRLDVIFVDFGNREAVNLSQIRSMAEEFVSLPVQALRCSLSGLLPEEALHPDPATCSSLEQVAASSKMTCRVMCRSPLLVELVLPATGDSVRVELARTGKLSRLPPTASFTLPASSISPSSTSEVIITHVEGPESFWVQVINSSEITQLPALMERVGQACASSSAPTSYLPQLGELCCAQFSEDRVWYRGRVVSFPSLAECCVQFVDYGNSEVAAATAVLPISEEFLSLPALAVHCCLVGWEDGGGERGREPARKEAGERGRQGERGQEEVQRFKDMVLNKPLLALHKGELRGKVVVELVNQSSVRDVYIHKKLQQ